MNIYCTIFKDREVDGPTLLNCKTEKDLTGLGIDIVAKARTLLKEIKTIEEVHYDLFCVVTLISFYYLQIYQEVPKFIGFDNNLLIVY